MICQAVTLTNNPQAIREGKENVDGEGIDWKALYAEANRKLMEPSILERLVRSGPISGGEKIKILTPVKIMKPEGDRMTFTDCNLAEGNKKFRHPDMARGYYCHRPDKDGDLVVFNGNLTPDRMIPAFALTLHDYLTRNDWEFVEEEVIEVGDIVKYGTDPRECEVIAVSEEEVCWEEVGNFCSTSDLDRLTLVSKGPTVHVFKSVGITKNGGLIGEDVEHSLHEKGCAFYNLRANGKTYEATFKEEA